MKKSKNFRIIVTFCSSNNGSNASGCFCARHIRV